MCGRLESVWFQFFSYILGKSDRISMLDFGLMGRHKVIKPIRIEGEHQGYI